MKKRLPMFSSRFSLAALLVLLLAAPRPAAAIPAAPENAAAELTAQQEENVQDFLQHYYLAPDPERAMELLPAVASLVASHPNAVAPMAGFYTGVVATDPDHADEWRSLLETDIDGWVPVAVELGLDPDARAEKLDPALAEPGPAELDFLWGWFSATGDREAPRRIIRRGGIVYPAAATFDLTQAAAAWSAKAQAREHPVVAEELNAYVLAASDDELRVFFGDSRGVASVRSILSPESLSRLDSLFPPPPENPTPLP